MIKLDELKTPCYVIDINKFESNINLFKNNFALKMNGRMPIMGYSVKTNNTPALLKEAKKQDMYAEVVSDDEYRLALKCGYTPNCIIFNGPQKSEELLIWSLKNKSIVNLDNFEEINMIKKNIAEIKCEDVIVGLRVNFDLEKVCPGETTAGREGSRFGFCVENGDFEKAFNLLKEMGITIKGIHTHYSSKSRSLNIYKELANMAVKLLSKYLSEPKDAFIDIGGGFFLGEKEKIAGKPTVQEYAETIVGEIEKYDLLKDVNLIIEPGAALMATSVSYITKVINERYVRDKKIVTVDGTILHINPFMAKRNPIAEYIYMHEGVIKINEQIICGATCMENDRFLKLNDKREMKIGDYLKCNIVGAYTMVFNSNFINLPPYIYIYKDGRLDMLRDKKDILFDM